MSDVLTMDPRDYLQPKMVEGILHRELEKNLTFKDMFPQRTIGGTRFQYTEDLQTAGDDISDNIQGTPEELTEEADLSLIELSSVSFKHGVTGAVGFEVKINPKVLREVGIIDEIQRAYSHASYGLAKKFNEDTVTAIQACETANSITPVAGGAAWSSDDADPISDIVKFKKSMKLEGYNSRLTDMFIHPDNMSEFELYMIGVDRNWSVDPTGEGALPSIRGVTLHEAATDEVSEAAYIGLDRRAGFEPLRVYKYMDPDRSTNPADNRIMVNRYKEEKRPYRICIEMEMEYGFARPLPNSAIYRASSI